LTPKPNGLSGSAGSICVNSRYISPACRGQRRGGRECVCAAHKRRGGGSCSW
jgi:hypothetical protein